MTWLTNILEFKLIDLDRLTISVWEVTFIILILLISQLITWGLNRFYYRKLAQNRRLSEGKVFAIQKLTKYLVYFIAILIIFPALGINLTFIIASSAALLVGVGIGLQHTFNDIVSGIILLFEGSIQIGDVIQIGEPTENDQELLGIVREIGLRTSVIETRDQIHIIIPNSQIVGNNVVNWSHGRRLTRLRVSVDVAYGTDEEKVREVLKECAMQEEEVEQNPNPSVRLAQFGDSGLKFELLYYTKNIINIGRVRSNIRFNIYKAFRDHGIVIPFPQRDVHHITQKEETD